MRHLLPPSSLRRISRGLLTLILSLVFPFATSLSVHAIDPVMYGTESAVLRASIPKEVIYPPVLLSPLDNSAVNTPLMTFRFQRASSNYAIDHYDLYVDDQVYAGGISHDALNEDAYYYTSSRNGEEITVTLKTALGEGYHHWKVVATSISTRTAESATWLFYLDSIEPTIVLKQVGNNTNLNWSTADPNSIPSVDQRNLNVNVSNPLFSGTVEIYANIKIDLICPSGASGCTSFSQTMNSPDGNWSYTFNNLRANVTYTARITATDASNNHSALPDFTVTYVPETPPTTTVTASPTPTTTATPTATISPTTRPTTSPTTRPTTRPSTSVTPTPSLTLSPSASPSASPTATPSATISPTIPFITITPSPSISIIPFPPPPTLPPYMTPPSPLDRLKASNRLFIFGLFALVIHLSLIIFGTGTKPTSLPILLKRLFFPLFWKSPDDISMSATSSSSLSTLPFTSIKVFSLEPLRDRLSSLLTLTANQLPSVLEPLLRRPFKEYLTDTAACFDLSLPKGLYYFTSTHPGYLSPDRLMQLPPDPQNVSGNLLYIGQLVVIDDTFTPNSTISMNNIIIPNDSFSWLFPLDKKSPDLLTALERLQLMSLTIRIVPLILSTLLLILSVVLSISPLKVLIFISSLILIYSEFIYPRTKVSN